MINYKAKYLKYKNKYLMLKKTGGSISKASNNNNNNYEKRVYLLINDSLDIGNDIYEFTMPSMGVPGDGPFFFF